MSELDKWIKKELIKLKKLLNEDFVYTDYVGRIIIDFNGAMQQTAFKEVWNEKIE